MWTIGLLCGYHCDDSALNTADSLEKLLDEEGKQKMKCGKNGMMWVEKARELKKFREENGHCNVPVSHEQLGGWVSRQRSLWGKSRQSQNFSIRRERILTMMGFQWESNRHRFEKKDELWMQRLDELKLYKEKHGDCLVPRRSKDKKLALWVSNQRQQYKKKKREKKGTTLTNERIKLLDEVGFVWTCRGAHAMHQLC